MNWFVASIGAGIGVASTLLALAAERRYGFPCYVRLLVHPHAERDLFSRWILVERKMSYETNHR